MVIRGECSMGVKVEKRNEPKKQIYRPETKKNKLS
jgi:hypothetical protein